MPNDRVNLVSRAGSTVSVPRDQAQEYLNNGYRLEMPLEESGRNVEETIENTAENRGGATRAFGEGALDTLSLGGFTALERALGADPKDIAATRNVHPGAYTAGGITAGILSLGAGGEGALAKVLTGTPAGAVTRAGLGVERAVGATQLGRTGGLLASGAFEGAMFGAGQGVSNLVLHDEPLTADVIYSEIGGNALLGAGFGAGGGLAARGLEGAAAKVSGRIGRRRAVAEAQAKLEDLLEGSSAQAKKLRQDIEEAANHSFDWTDPRSTNFSAPIESGFSQVDDAADDLVNAVAESRVASSAGEAAPSASRSVLSDEAEDLLRKVDEGGVPAFMSNNLRRIARDNGIEVSASHTPQDIIDELRVRRAQGHAVAEVDPLSDTYADPNAAPIEQKGPRQKTSPEDSRVFRGGPPDEPRVAYARGQSSEEAERLIEKWRNELRRDTIDDAAFADTELDLGRSANDTYPGMGPSRAPGQPAAAAESSKLESILDEGDSIATGGRPAALAKKRPKGKGMSQEARDLVDEIQASGNVSDPAKLRRVAKEHGIPVEGRDDLDILNDLSKQRGPKTKPPQRDPWSMSKKERLRFRQEQRRLWRERLDELAEAHKTDIGNPPAQPVPHRDIVDAEGLQVGPHMPGNMRHQIQRDLDIQAAMDDFQARVKSGEAQKVADQFEREAIPDIDASLPGIDARAEINRVAQQQEEVAKAVVFAQEDFRRAMGIKKGGQFDQKALRQFLEMDDPRDAILAAQHYSDILKKSGDIFADAPRLGENLTAAADSIQQAISSSLENAGLGGKGVNALDMFAAADLMGLGPDDALPGEAGSVADGLLKAWIAYRVIGGMSAVPRAAARSSARAGAIKGAVRAGAFRAGARVGSRAMGRGVFGDAIGWVAGARVGQGAVDRLMSGVGNVNHAVQNTVNKIDAALLKAAKGGTRAARATGHFSPSILNSPLFGAQPEKEPANEDEALEQRLNEIRRAAAQPEGIRRAAMKSMKPLGVLSMPVADKIAQRAAAAASFLAERAPKDPGTVRWMGKSKWRPSDNQKAAFLRYLHYVLKPRKIIDDYANGLVTPEGADVLANLTPGLNNALRQAVVRNMNELQDMPYEEQIKLSLLTGKPTNYWMEHPERAMKHFANQAQKAAQQQQGPGQTSPAPPTPRTAAQELAAR